MIKWVWLCLFIILITSISEIFLARLAPMNYIQQLVAVLVTQRWLLQLHSLLLLLVPMMSKETNQQDCPYLVTELWRLLHNLLMLMQLTEDFFSVVDNLLDASDKTLQESKGTAYTVAK